MSTKFSELFKEYITIKDFYFSEMKIPESKISIRCSSIGALKEGKVIGACPLLTAYRVLNINPSLNFSANMIFSLGFINEEVWQEALRFNDLKFKYEPLRLSYDFGKFFISGTPDIIVYDKNDMPVYGLELKCIASDKTTIGVISAPKEEHALQTGIYSFILKIPFNIVYTKYFIDGYEPGCFEYLVESRYLQGIGDNVIHAQGIGTLCTITDVYNYCILVNNILAEHFDTLQIYELGATVPETFESSACMYCQFKSYCNKKQLNETILIVYYELPKFLYKFYVNKKAALELADGFTIEDKTQKTSARSSQDRPDTDDEGLDLNIYYNNELVGVMRPDSLIFFNGLFRFLKTPQYYEKYKKFHERCVKQRSQ